MKQIFSIIIIISVLVGCNNTEHLDNSKGSGLSEKRLSLIDTMLLNLVSNKKLPGATVLIYRNNQIAYHKSFGYSNIEKSIPMQNDNIYGILSMTKLVTSVAALTLYEKGYFLLNDKLSDYLPEFKNMKVFHNQEGKTLTKEANNDILIKDLFRHTSGLTYDSPEYTKVNANLNEVKSLEQFAQNISNVPLYCEPGTKFQYSYSTDILGYLIEKLSGKSLRDYMIENIFNPLEMTDTDFILSEDKIDRMVNFYSYKNDSLTLKELNRNSIYLNKSRIFSGGGGLISTTKDYANFLNMIVNYGNFDNKTILSRKTIELLSSDFLVDVKDKGFLNNGRGHGLGVGVIPKASNYGELFSDGSIFWAGIRNTYYWVDYKENMFGIIMTQVSPFLFLPYMEKFRILTYQSIID